MFGFKRMPEAPEVRKMSDMFELGPIKFEAIKKHSINYEGTLESVCSRGKSVYFVIDGKILQFQ
jgi:hypothetical protein